MDPAPLPADLATRPFTAAEALARGVVRPGAPVTAYLMGVAVGRGAQPADVADRLSEIALSWPTPAP